MDAEYFEFTVLAETDDREYMRPRWWFGGVASAGVACLVAPFDLVKTHMQTQKNKKGMYETAQKVIKLRGCDAVERCSSILRSSHWLSIPIGFQGFYDGFGAAAMRQMICTSMRFSLYEVGKDLGVMKDTLITKIIIASVAGASSSAIGIPLDVINIRMQNDMKCDYKLRRKYCLIQDFSSIFHFHLIVFLCFSSFFQV